MKFILDDKNKEKHRYDKFANIISDSKFTNLICEGSKLISKPISSPYVFYESTQKKIIKKNFKVLEIGCGVGTHTFVALTKSSDVVATDISNNSLLVLKKRFKNFKNLTTKVVDMENISFNNETFDVVISAGSLSYGDNQIVAKEINRVLKPNGYFICVDSFNHNPIYKFNRWIHFKSGRRSLSTIRNMPNKQLIEYYKNIFKSVKVKYFGAVSFVTPLLSVFISEKKIKNFIDLFDHVINVQKSAFKFVMIAKKTERKNGKFF
jgi:ubiquinone/menaquinone biosynthesis C-methylase UbiE